MGLDVAGRVPRIVINRYACAPFRRQVLQDGGDGISVGCADDQAEFSAGLERGFDNGEKLGNFGGTMPGHRSRHHGNETLQHNPANFVSDRIYHLSVQRGRRVNACVEAFGHCRNAGVRLRVHGRGTRLVARGVSGGAGPLDDFRVLRYGIGFGTWRR
jgi:hypothetical protein